MSIHIGKCWHFRASHHQIENYKIIIHTKHIKSRRNLKTSVALLYQEHSLIHLTSWHVQGSLHSCRPMIFYAARTPLSKSATPLLQSFLFTTSVGLVMLKSGRYLNRLVREGCDWFLILQWLGCTKVRVPVRVRVRVAMSYSYFVLDPPILSGKS